MHRKGKLGLLVVDGRSDMEIEDLCSEWLLPPVHDSGLPIANDIEIQHVEWAGEKTPVVTTERQSQSVDAQPEAFFPRPILWALAAGVFAILHKPWGNDGSLIIRGTKGKLA